MFRIPDPTYLRFPFEVANTGGQSASAVSKRADHVREQIEQVLFTNPNERVFRPEFGAGLRLLVFEPNRAALWELTQKRLRSALSEVLRGEVDPATLEIEVDGEEAALRVRVSYTLARLGYHESHAFSIGTGAF